MVRKILKSKYKTKKSNPERYYVDKAEFLKELIVRKNKIKENNNQWVPVHNELAKFFYVISENISNRYNFASYTFKSDMVSEAVEICLKRVDNFDSEHFSNPFGYFSKVIFWTFVQNIKKEKKQLYIRYKTFLNTDFLFETEEGHDILQKHDSLVEYKQEFVDNYEDYLEKKKEYAKEQKRKKKPDGSSTKEVSDIPKVS